MLVPDHMHITASLMAGYTMFDGSLVEVSISGDYKITNGEGKELIDTHRFDTPNMELKFGTPPEDYGDIMDDLAAFLRHDADLHESRRLSEVDPADPDGEDDYIFGPAIARWANDHEDELSILSGYREDKRLGEDFFAREEA